MSFDNQGWIREDRKRRWRWPYQLRPDVSYWVRGGMRASLFFGALGLLFLAWNHYRG